MSELTNLSKVHKSAQQVVESYAKELLKVLGDNVCSIIVYGSSISEEFIPKRSNINLLVVCKEVTIAELRKCFKIKNKGIVPLFLTKTHIETSSDAFPIEFLDIADSHQTIYGDDVFSNLNISTENLRLECEEQLKGKLIRLRQAYLEAKAKYKAIKTILNNSITSLLAIFRSMLRLTGKTPLFIQSEIINTVSKDFEVDADTFLKVLSLKTGKLKLGRNEIERLFENYIKEIEKLAIAVDKLKK